VLLDDREDVRQQSALDLGEIGAIDQRTALNCKRVDGRAAVARPLAGGSSYAAFAVSLVSHLLPST